MKNKPSFLTNKSIAPFMLPGFSTQDLFYHMNTRSRYLTHLKNAVDNFKARQTLIDARVENIKRQQLTNYQGEYDRIMAAVNRSAIPGLSEAMLRKRESDLKKLAGKALRAYHLEY